jgi:outer membrane protein
MRTPLPALRRLALGALLVGASLAGGTAHADSQSRIAFVDVQRAVMATEDGMRAAATMKKHFDRRQSELESRQNELAKMRDDIEKQQYVVSREALQRRTEDWQKRMLELQTAFVEYNKELQKKQADLTGPIVRKMSEMIARLAKKNGYEAVLDKQMAAYVRPDLDLTEKVVQMYNTGGGGDEGGGEEKKAEPAKP